MTYATGRTFYDADSHIMDLPDFLQRYADPDVRAVMPNKASATAGHIGHNETLTEAGHPQAYRAELLALGDELISGPKNYRALGAFCADERSQALDLLGFGTAAKTPSFSSRRHGDVAAGPGSRIGGPSFVRGSASGRSFGDRT